MQVDDDIFWVRLPLWDRERLDRWNVGCSGKPWKGLTETGNLLDADVEILAVKFGLDGVHHG